MSRIGRMPVAIPAGVTVEIVNNYMTVKGPKGTLERELPVEMAIKEEDGHIIVLDEGIVMGLLFYYQAIVDGQRVSF